MEGNRRWFGWIAIGLGALALLIALAGRGFGPQMGFGGANMQQSYSQQGPGPQGAGTQSGPFAPGANAQQGPQSGPLAPGANVQRGQGRPGSGPQGSPAAPGTEQRHGPGRLGDGGFGLGGWFRFPLRLIGGAFQTGMLALLIVLGVWLLRRRSADSATGSLRAEPAQGPSQEPPS